MSGISLGAWLQLPSPDVAEILARSGVAWVCVDMEHGSMTLSDLPDIFRAIEAGGAQSWVRVRAHVRTDDVIFRRLVDLGAQAIILADTQNAMECWYVVDAISHPTQRGGRRGYGFARCNGWGARFSPEPCEPAAVYAQIESEAGLRDLPSILTTTGVRGAFVGPLDLCASLGVPPDPASPALRTALKAVVAGCRRRTLEAGIHVVRPTPEAIEDAVKAGYTLLALGLDGSMLSGAMGAAVEAAKAVTV
jgi:2-keto-3-deoxy-L-rhamnonate aldolase RhmA